jgi:hypothetical protein
MSIFLDVPSTTTTTTRTSTGAAVVMPCSQPASANCSLGDIALEETPPDKRRTQQKQPDDYHVIICWSQLSNLIKKNMVCLGCGNPICELHCRTIGIATEIDCLCKCRKRYTAYAD